MIELRLLRYFVAVAETEHVGRAASQLHISQSPLSRQVRQLEDQLGVQLFERARRRIRLTGDGRRLLGPARDLLARAHALERGAREAARGEPRRIRIGFVSTAVWAGILPAALRELGAREPDAQIALRQLRSAAQLEAMRAGELDLAFVHTMPRTSDLVARRVLEQPYELALPRAHPLARRTVRAAHLEGERWIAVVAGERDRDRWVAACGAAGFTPTIAVEVSDWASALALVEAGAGVSLVPASYRAAAPPGVVLRALPWLGMRARLFLVRRARGESPLADDVARWTAGAARPTPWPRRRGRARRT
ncbi:MAG TPA: LysR substrate-binding domain-containing protein [Kofleriaceae bacterium]|nr:LysR substrate-binding domain-containing protein [Kofleriaceae bacterium]